MITSANHLLYMFVYLLHMHTQWKQHIVIDLYVQCRHEILSIIHNFTQKKVTENTLT